MEGPLQFGRPVLDVRRPAGAQPGRTALVLSGGGARTAYQVGVLAELMDIRREAVERSSAAPTPFNIVVGTSAGAINAFAIAMMADDLDRAIERLLELWANIHTAQVVRSDAMGVGVSGARWLATFALGWALPRSRWMRPQSLLDNSPLSALLKSSLEEERLDVLIASGALHAFAVTASSYTSGEHLTFYQSAEAIRPWSRSKRRAVRQPIRIAHLLASAAIPFIFPAVPLDIAGRRHWCGDGSIRLMAPLAPAIHLGADRLLVIGCGSATEPKARSDGEGAASPSLASIGGHALSAVFLDALDADLERLGRINRTVALLDAQSRARTSLRPIEVLAIEPSRPIADLAESAFHAMPRPVRAMLRAVGVDRREQSARGMALASYLLFESAFTRSLIQLGREDVRARRAECCGFFGWPDRVPYSLKSES